MSAAHESSLCEGLKISRKEYRCGQRPSSEHKTRHAQVLSVSKLIRHQDGHGASCSKWYITVTPEAVEQWSIVLAIKFVQAERQMYVTVLARSARYPYLSSTRRSACALPDG